MHKTKSGLPNPSGERERVMSSSHSLHLSTPLRALRPGGKIGICAPSGFLPAPEKLPIAVQRLESHGYTVSVSESILDREGYCAGSAQTRLANVHQLVADPSVDLVMAARGGFGLSHLLPFIDWHACAQSGKLFCGFSDFTAFHMGLYAQTGRISLAGPMAVTDFAGEDESVFHSQYFWNLIHPTADSADFFPKWETDQSCSPTQLKGRLWGGNLSLFTHLMGTPWFPTIEGGILFLEEIGEAPYRIERMLMQLELAGVLHHQQAIILGAFTGCTPPPDAPSQYALHEVITHLRQRFKGPVVTGLPFGHIKDKVTLPFGAVSYLDLDGLNCRLSWDALLP